MNLRPMPLTRFTNEIFLVIDKYKSMQSPTFKLHIDIGRQLRIRIVLKFGVPNFFIVIELNHPKYKLPCS